MKEKVLTVTLDDCEVQTFRCGGPGGQKQNKTSSGVRIIHHPSGARGESREQRSQLQNKKSALERLSKTPAFVYWVALQTGRFESDEAYIKRQMSPEKIKVEVKENGKWIDESS